jgi:hypothetical protein
LPVLTSQHIKVILEDLKIQFQLEELNIFCCMVSQERNSDEITFEDFLEWLLPDLETGDTLKHNLLQKWSNHAKYLDPDDGEIKELNSRANFGSTQIKEKFNRFFNSTMSKYQRK